MFRFSFRPSVIIGTISPHLPVEQDGRLLILDYWPKSKVFGGDVCVRSAGENGLVAVRRSGVQCKIRPR